MQTASELVDQTGVDGSVAGDARLGGEERGTDLEVEVWGVEAGASNRENGGGGRGGGGGGEGRGKGGEDDVRKEQIYMGARTGSAGLLEGWPCRAEEGDSG